MPQFCLAMDFSPETNLKLCQRFEGLATYVKIGPQNIFEQGNDIIARYRDLGFQIFLDFKFHDIPSTVARVASVLKDVSIMTMHLAGGKEAFDLVKQRAPSIQLAGVAQLTSLSHDDWKALNLPANWAKEIRKKALDWPLDYFVMSGAEFIEESPVLPAIIPGLRLKEGVQGDQKNVSKLENFLNIDSKNILVLGRILQEPETLGILQQCH